MEVGSLERAGCWTVEPGVESCGHWGSMDGFKSGES